MTKNLNEGIVPRRATDRFHSSHGWLDSWHTFSFADHYDPAFAGLGPLRVLNDDTVAPKMGFGTHPHQNMEIISYVISGQLAHRDSLGNGRTIRAGESQYLSAGKGITHSEFNPSSELPVHFLQIWIAPQERDGEPRYQEKSISSLREKEGLTLIASPDGQQDSIAIRQQAFLNFGRLSAGSSLTPESPANSHWLHLIKGSLTLAGESLHPGDGAALSGSLPNMSATSETEFLLFHL